MSVLERWDVVLKVLSGPLAGMGEQVLKGPIVRIGVAPGAGGLKLVGYRGVDRRHAVISAYDSGTATIGPVGSNHVRMAPHAHVNWTEIDPMSGPEYLSKGCAVHLGPVNRGVTLEFVECRKLAVKQVGRISSETVGANVASGAFSRGPGVQPQHPGGPPQSFNPNRSTRVNASSVPFWFVGCLFLMAFSTLTVIAAAVLITAVQTDPLGPIEDGEEFYDFVSTDKIDERLLEGLQQGYLAFVMRPNAEASGRPALGKPDNWDEVFYEHVVASVEAHIRAWSVFRRLDAIRKEYGEVVRVMKDNGLPEVFAGIPYQESRYRPRLQSVVCARGFWQFMPEVAHRIDVQTSLTFKVRDCRFEGQPNFLWNPEALTPPRGVRKNGPYMSDGKCRISKCRVDHREDLEKSTEAAAFVLKEAWDDAEIAGSGAAVQMVITSHNAGYDDSRVGVAKKTNVLPAYMAWKRQKKRREWSKFIGDNITTKTTEGHRRKGSVFPPEAQHYAYTIIAQHLIAVCYYGQNYSDMSVFSRWADYASGEGYCNGLTIPTAKEVRGRGKGS